MCRELSFIVLFRAAGSAVRVSFRIVLFRTAARELPVSMAR